LAWCTFQGYRDEKLRNRIPNWASTSIEVPRYQQKSFAATTKGVRPICTYIQAVWPLFEKICKEGNDLMLWFSSNLVDPSPIYSSSSLGFGELIFTPTPQTLAISYFSRAVREIEDPEPREETETEKKTRTKKHLEFESSIFVVFYVVFITFVRMSLVLAICTFTTFL
jgi:hypothetical protein